MALLTCPDCNNKVSSHAKECIHCGCPQAFFDVSAEKENLQETKGYILFVDNEKIQRDLIAFINEYVQLIFSDQYISNKESKRVLEKYKHIYNTNKGESK